MSVHSRVTLGAPVALWLEQGVPCRLIHEGVVYEVFNTPTRLEDDMMMTHPLPISGWRFQGTDERQQSLMFDIRRDGEVWRLMRVYE